MYDPQQPLTLHADGSSQGMGQYCIRGRVHSEMYWHAVVGLSSWWKQGTELCSTRPLQWFRPLIIIGTTWLVGCLQLWQKTLPLLLHHMKDPCNMMTMWIMELHEYDYNIVHLTEKTHLDPDCLSCHFQPLQTGDTDGINNAFIFALATHIGLAKEQDKDPILWQLKQLLRADPIDLAVKH